MYAKWVFTDRKERGAGAIRPARFESEFEHACGKQNKEEILDHVHKERLVETSDGRIVGIEHQAHLLCQGDDRPERRME